MPTDVRCVVTDIYITVRKDRRKDRVEISVEQLQAAANFVSIVEMHHFDLSCRLEYGSSDFSR